VARRCRGIAEVPAAVTEAGLALASMRSGAHGVASVFDDPLAVLVAAEPALATLMLREVLGPLLERPERERDTLLDTLVAFDDCDASVPAVAERVFCHRNTVLNRLTKITRLTGISFTAPSGVALVALAARAIRAGLLLADEPA
jgi:DNA-binding PucR family transcriptional regulator